MRDSSLIGRVAIVTGGARGIGRILALALVRAGAQVLITARSPAEIDRTVADARSLAAGACKGMVADVSERRDCEATVAAAERLFGPVGVLVNNAGVGPGSLVPRDAAGTSDRFMDPDPAKRLRFWETDPDACARLIATNLSGVYQMSQAAAGAMVERGFGRVVNISTSVPVMRMPGFSPYGPVKAAVEASTLVWAQELAGSGVTANVLLPGGPTDTAFIPGGDVGVRAPVFAAGKQSAGLEGTNVNRFLLPPEIMAPPMLWLASDGSAETSGRRIVARDWDPDLPVAAAAERAMQPRSAATVVM
ncbi:SDR family NAD(P)-dependent oxidoreductase [uncultured Sphingomonas sp.]|uniref:SDR family NAD(P)-dependent oxidoreductase n=1 Tax=uncultured Sphingomonas sp. TaxID=158754 RepID=UPI0035CBC679